MGLELRATHRKSDSVKGQSNIHSFIHSQPQQGWGEWKVRRSITFISFSASCLFSACLSNRRWIRFWFFPKWRMRGALKVEGLMKTVVRFYQTVTEDHYSENIQLLVTDNETSEESNSLRLLVCFQPCVVIFREFPEKTHNLSVRRQNGDGQGAL